MVRRNTNVSADGVMSLQPGFLYSAVVDHPRIDELYADFQLIHTLFFAIDASKHMRLC